MEKKKNQKLNKYSINIQSIRIDFTQNFRLKCHNSLSRPVHESSLYQRVKAPLQQQQKKGDN